MSPLTNNQYDVTEGAPDWGAQDIENRSPQGKFSTRCASTIRTRTDPSPLPDASASGGTLMRGWGTRLIDLETIVNDRRTHALISTCASPGRGAHSRSARYFDLPLRSGPATPPKDQCA